MPFVRAVPAPDNVPVNLPFFSFGAVWSGQIGNVVVRNGGNAWKQLQQHLRGGLGIVWVHSADHISYRMLWTCQDPSETESWLEPPKLAREIRRPIANVSLGRQRNFVNRLGGSVR